MGHLTYEIQVLDEVSQPEGVVDQTGQGRREVR
jgi:hypothetical protein